MNRPALENLTISVRAAPDTNDHEVCLHSECGDLIDRFDDTMIGLDPDDILVPPCRLLPAEEPRQVMIGRCSCGIIGCGSVEVRIESDGEVVTWSTYDGQPMVRFDRAQYVAEVQRALSDFSWETPDRTAARLIAGRVNRELLARRGVKYAWASGRHREATMTVALEYRGAGLYQLLVHVPWQGESPEQVAEKCRRVLKEEPSAWGEVVWYPQAQGLGAPEIAGPGWHRC